MSPRQKLSRRKKKTWKTTKKVKEYSTSTSENVGRPSKNKKKNDAVPMYVSMSTDKGAGELGGRPKCQFLGGITPV